MGERLYFFLLKTVFSQGQWHVVDTLDLLAVMGKVRISGRYPIPSYHFGSVYASD
jgi:hypothetical protein